MVATIEEVEDRLTALVARLGNVDPSHRAMLPARRTIQAFCTDLGLMYHAVWRNGRLDELVQGPADRADIRIQMTSADLVALADGELPFREAYTSQRVRIDASLTDLLRLRAAL